ncbi:hypothetical protein NDU88_002221 [Pleurodeles waltl]|uniref:Uncharacterized protein n=1 Tax=Pleurodeles waltl TaxID=8319 RepID=A0AAV7MN82_PLEWA|nr:hypothetical protein NDU88_002221 [Pleurodeles waltl]
MPKSPRPSAPPRHRRRPRAPGPAHPAAAASRPGLTSPQGPGSSRAPSHPRCSSSCLSGPGSQHRRARGLRTPTHRSRPGRPGPAHSAAAAPASRLSGSQRAADAAPDPGHLNGAPPASRYCIHMTIKGPGGGALTNASAHAAILATPPAGAFKSQV